MEINLLTLNVGNSRLAIGVFVAGELGHIVRLPIAEKSAWPEAIATAWKLIANRERPTVAAAGVNPGESQAIEAMVVEQTNTKIQWVGREIDLPINVLTDAPKETGVDRIINIAAAFEQLGKACVVVDAGTAITVDFCNDNGDFLGGAIFPGMQMMLDALHEKTAKLPLVKFQVPQGTLGTSTASAICHGVYHGIRGLVKEMVENHAMGLGQWPEVIATGGDARVLFEDWELIHAVAPDLTLYGIALAYTEHHIRLDAGN